MVLALFLLCRYPALLGSEVIKVTTYYPAPYAAYASVIVSGRAMLGVDGGTVGVGTANPDPAYSLHVAGEPNGTAKNFGVTNGGLMILNSNPDKAGVWVRSAPNIPLDDNTVSFTGAHLGLDGGGSLVMGGGDRTPYMDFHGTSGSDYDARIIVQRREDFLDLSFKFAAAKATLGGLCAVYRYRMKYENFCPAEFPLLMGRYGPESLNGPMENCASGRSLLQYADADLHDKGSWVPEMIQNCGGRMLCCKFQAPYR
jgi:hypothetical protein